jgi:hypothetical protein
MNGYMLSNKQLVCEVIPKERQHKYMFRYRKKRIDSPSQPPKLLDADKLREIRRMKREKLREAGIDFDLNQVFKDCENE